jgi:hypothetical protein
MQETHPEPETEEEAITAIEAIADDHRCTLHENYSGRGMYGRTCYGVSGPEKFIMMEAGRQNLPEPELDNMGKGIIAYWPSIRGDDS